MKPRGTIQRDAISYNGLRVHNGCLFTYTVSGRGRFPDDMLRYDVAMAFGVTEVDISAVKLSFWNETREVKIIGKGCTPERWRSFGWSVHDDIVEVADHTGAQT